MSTNKEENIEFINLKCDNFVWSSDTHRPEERLLDLLCEYVEHFNRLCGQGQIRARHPLILSQLGLAALLLFLKVCREKQNNTTLKYSSTVTFCQVVQLSGYCVSRCTHLQLCYVNILSLPPQFVSLPFESLFNSVSFRQFLYHNHL